MLNLPPKLKAEPELIEKWSLLSVNSTSLQREPFSIGGHAGIRTQGPILKRDVLYRLSYVTSGNNISGFTQELSGIPILCPGFTGKGCKGRYFFENCKTLPDFQLSFQPFSPLPCPKTTQTPLFFHSKSPQIHARHTKTLQR